MNDALANDMSAIKHELHHLIVLSFTYRRSLELHRLLNVHSPGVVQIETVARERIVALRTILRPQT